MGMRDRETDWTVYYQKKKSFFSAFTQRFTLQKILGILSDYMDGREISILEMGGANSCFAEDICRSANVGRYDIIDNNELGVSLFQKKRLSGAAHHGILEDLTKEPAWDRKYDFVYSIGLIEHFQKRERDKVIASHFKFCKDNGIVMISFPTPTFQYRCVRKCMEIAGAWQFFDEHPLRIEDVKGTLGKRGDILRVELNKKLPLTQMITVSRKG